MVRMYKKLFLCSLVLSFGYWFGIYDESDWYSVPIEDMKELSRDWALRTGIPDNPVVNVSWKKDDWIYSTHGGPNKMYWWSKNITAKYPLNHQVYFHTLWKFLGAYHDDIELPNHILFVFNSYLATQDLENTRLIFWTNYNVSNHKILKTYFSLPYIMTKVYNPKELSIGTPVEKMNWILEQQDSIVYSDGDLFRLLAIYQYGGVYFDCDTVLLRDFTPLLSQQFLYQWDTYKSRKALMNGAVIHSFPKSKWVYLLLKELPTMCVGQVCWGKDLYKKVYYKYQPDHTIFPCFMFDPDWYLFGTFGESPRRTYAFDYFEKRSENPSYQLNDLYDGIFAYHWHGRWKSEVEKGSKRDQISKLHLQIIKSKLPEFNPQSQKTVMVSCSTLPQGIGRAHV